MHVILILLIKNALSFLSCVRTSIRINKNFPSGCVNITSSCCSVEFVLSANHRRVVRTQSCSPMNNWQPFEVKIAKEETSAWHFVASH